MYIAFKWLLGITLTVWAAVSCLSLFIRTHDKIKSQDFQARYSKKNFLTNSSITRINSENFVSDSKYRKLRNNVKKYKVIETAYLHYAMFLAAAVVVGMVNQKLKLFVFSKDKLIKLEITSLGNKLENGSKFCFLNVSTVSSVAIRVCLSMCRNVGNSLASCFTRKNPSLSNTWVHLLLIKKLEEIVEEKNRLAQLLLTSIQENKNLKTRNHLETVTKNRLMKLIEDSQMNLKDFKMRFASLQNLNMINHQENISLKSCLDKVNKEKVETNKTLMAIIRKIYESKNTELMQLCETHALSKDSLQNIEIRKVLETPNTHCSDTTEDFTTGPLPTISDSMTALHPLINNDNGDRVVPFVTLKPKPKGHHNEYLWTVKDSDGLIERIYEYDKFDSDHNNGDMIRRIREYSVFCEKDCVLDGKSSRTILSERSDFIRLKIADQKFLTGSEAFQSFLRNNKSFVTSPPPSSPRTSHLICG